MKTLMISMLLVLVCGLCEYASADCNKGYASVGAGYKFMERTKVTINGVDFQPSNQSPYSARFELGVECESIKFGVAHRSQWLEGWPINDHKEYAVNEVFIEYKVYLW